MTALLDRVLAQASLVPDAEHDAFATRFLQILKEVQGEKPQEKPQEKPRPQFGSAKGMFTLTPDFDEPITDFAGPGEGSEDKAERPRARFGSAKGQGYMTPDFDEPLEEFAEYM